MESLREYLAEPSLKYTVSNLSYTPDTKEYLFDLDFKDQEYSIILSKVKVKAFNDNGIVIKLYCDNKEFQSKGAENSFFETLNSINTKLKLGCLKYSIKQGREPIYLTCALAPVTYNENDNKKVFLGLLDALIEELYYSISELLYDFKDYSEDFSESEEGCSQCEDKWICNCDLNLGMKEEEIDVLEELYENLEENKKIFDFDENFYCQESQKYIYCPQNTLEQRLKDHPLSENFWKNFDELISNMVNSEKFCMKFPSKLLMVNLISSKIASIKIAPAFKNSKTYKDWFTSEPVTDFQRKMEKEVMGIILGAVKVSRVKVENFIKVESLDRRDYNSDNLMIGEGGFAKVYSNSINNKQVVLKIPSLKKETLAQSQVKIVNEFSVCIQIDGNNTVKPYGIIEFKDSSYGIIFEFCSGQSLRKKAASMSPAEIKEAMRCVANGIYHIHSKNFIHQDIKPSNIIFNNKAEPIIIDFGFAVKESQRYLINGFTTEYADPDQLMNKSPGKPADIWSFALTYFSVLLNGRPYGENINFKSFKAGQNLENKKEEEKIKRRFFYDEIKTKNKRPPFNLIKEKVSASVFEMLKNCLNQDPLSRPTIGDVLDVLNMND